MRPCCSIDRGAALECLAELPDLDTDGRSRYFVELPDGRRLPAKRAYCLLTGKPPGAVHPAEPLRYFARIGLTVGMS